jgi:hypothetical protein
LHLHKKLLRLECQSKNKKEQIMAKPSFVGTSGGRTPASMPNAKAVAGKTKAAANKAAAKAKAAAAKANKGKKTK